MAWYRAGTMDVSNGSAIVVGTGTAWVATVNPGDALITPQGPREIASVNSDTQLTLAANYDGTSQTGIAYAVQPTRAITTDLVAGVQTILDDFGAVRDNAGQGRFDYGTLAAPTVRGVADQDSGLNHTAANPNRWDLVAAGASVGYWSSTGLNAVTIGATAAAPATVTTLTVEDAVTLQDDVTINHGNAQIDFTGSGLPRITSIGGLRIDIDADNDDNNKAFTVTMDGEATTLFELSEDLRATLAGPIYFSPSSSENPTVNGQVAWEFTNDTTITLYGRGTDGTLRSTTLTIS